MFFVLRNIVALVFFLAVAYLVVWAIWEGPIGKSVSEYFKKRKEYYDVTKMDDAEILARKYEQEK